MLFSHRPPSDEFEAAAMPHMADIYRTASRLLGAGAGADDVVQDVYLQAWKSFSQFELGTNCRAWLFKILFHTLHHYRRKWLSIRMVKESEDILEQAAAGGPPARANHGCRDAGCSDRRPARLPSRRSANRAGS